MRLRRSARLTVSQGAVSLYVHNAQGEGLGLLGVSVAWEGAGDQSALKEVGRKIAMHVAGTPMPPLALSTDDLDPAAEPVARLLDLGTKTAIQILHLVPDVPQQLGLLVAVRVHDASSSIAASCSR